MALSLLLGLSSRGASPWPQPLPEWRLELVAEAPQIRHPSVVACAPDGRVFVAEDPMDISLPKADAAQGRILCLHPDGRITVFAEHLYAVFGLQYLDGRVYVLHNPRFSVFDDDAGVGSNRRELIAQTLPEPSALNWNDHVPANFHLGLDGFFYGASGDKGLHGAQGTDGSRAELSTGGIFRIRPDGSQLEVVSSGVRNILDVALNTEDEQFTYDNTDEHDWMGRFTHMVDGGFYGYPHDFIPRRPYTLWMMEDYGPGAACGVFANNEDALPPEFAGNVFLADFGKRQLMRVRLERAGGTYRAVSKEDLFPNPPGDFRPVGIAPGVDGKSIYVCDWQHRDEKADVSVGRLFKLTWNGKDHGVPKPGWYVAAATGQPFKATGRDLVAGLSHPSHNVRLTAQRRLSDRQATGDLVALLKDPAAAPQARVHALWALDAIDGGLSARREILAASRGADPLVRRQALRQLGTRRVAEGVPAAVDGLTHPDRSVRFQAATALGRIGDASPVPELLAGLDEPDLFARFAAFTALNRIGTQRPSAWPAIVDGLRSDRPRVREGAGFAMRETYDEVLLRALVRLFHDGPATLETRRGVLELIAALPHRKPAWKGQWWAYHPALQPPPEKSEPWAGTTVALATLRQGLQEQNPGLRRICIEALAVAHDPESALLLRGIFPGEVEPASRSAILRALGKMKDPATLELIAAELKRGQPGEATLAAISAAESIGGDQAGGMLATFLVSPDADADVTALARTIGALATLGAKSAAPAVERRLKHPSSTVRAASYHALGRLRGDQDLVTLEAGLVDSSVEVRRAVVQALGALKTPLAVPALIRAYADETVRAEALRELVRLPDERALGPLLDALSSKDPVSRNAAHLAVRTLSAKVRTAIEALTGTLSAQALVELRQIYAGNKAAEQGPIFAQAIVQPGVEDYLEAAVKRPGDPVRGRQLFAEPGGVNCQACHRVAGQGSDLGPDLSGIGAQFDRRALAEAVLYPSKTVREGYQQISVEMQDGEEISGLAKGETADILTLRDASGAEHKLLRRLIKSRGNGAMSLMPEGLHAGLSLAEFSDLIAYLSQLK